jgi:Leucine-rich repeat (LRR) protein
MVKQSSDQSLENPVELGSRFVGMSGLQLLRAEGNCLGSICNFLRQSNLLWLRWDRFPYSFLPSSIPMNELIVLQLAGDKLETLWQRENEAPLQLRELHIDADLLQIPKSIGQLKHLEKIVLKYTIETLPEELFHLRSLKHLSLSTRMTRLPNSLANLANLQYIDLSGCTNLQRLPSFGNLTELQHIHLNDCKMLQMLPVSFGNLIRLKNLSLSGCLNLTISSETLGDISTLESLDLSQCKKMEVLPPQVTNQRSLKILKLQCPLLEKLPASLGNLTSLQELTLNFCENLKSLPEMVRELKQLTTLIIANARIKHLPVGVRELNNLEHLSVSYCPLTEMPFHNVLANPRVHRMLDSSIDKCMYMVRLKDLDMHGTRIKELAFPEGFCPNLQRLNVSFCNELEEVGALPTTLLSLDLQDCSALKEIRGLSGLAKLQLLDISRCKKLKEMPGVETLASLEDLRGLTECKKLKNSIKKSVQDIIDTNRKRKS